MKSRRASPGRSPTSAAGHGNFIVTDDLNVSAADFDYFSVPVPNDPRLPSAGQTIGNFPNVRVLKPQDNVVTFASNYGEQYRRWNGGDATIDARVRNGLLSQGGVSTGKESTDNCEVVRNLPETIAGGIVQSLDYCHGEQPYQTHVKGLGSYSLPWWGCRSAAHSRTSPTVNSPRSETRRGCARPTLQPRLFKLGARLDF